VRAKVAIFFVYAKKLLLFLLFSEYSIDKEVIVRNNNLMILSIIILVMSETKVI